MVVPQNYKYNYEKEISNEEYDVINKFLAYYKNQSVIVADKFRQDFSMVPLENEKVIFKKDEDTWKSMSFCKKIMHNNRKYVVELSLWRTNKTEDAPKCLSINEFRIITKGEVHSITFDTKNERSENILFNIIDIFNENKIISPEQAYSKQMYPNEKLEKYITNHDWTRINTGINQMPILANALFKIREGYESCSHYTADFGTILYQLISFRMNNLDSFDEKDLRELDELILKLRETQLLKVQFHENLSSSSYNPTGTMLLKSNVHAGRVHSSSQYTVDNTELSEEQKTLNKCVKSLTLK